MEEEQRRPCFRVLDHDRHSGQLREVTLEPVVKKEIRPFQLDLDHGRHPCSGSEIERARAAREIERLVATKAVWLTISYSST